MTRALLIGAFTAATVLAAHAQTTMSQSECDALWKQANPSAAATITESQAQPYVSDFKAANPDGDGTLDQTEFSTACQQGLVKSAAAGGQPAGTDAGKAATKEGQGTSDRTPDKEAMTPEGQVDTTKEGATSDRTPSKDGDVKAGTTDVPKTGTKSGSGTFAASDQWIGRDVYSSDGKDIGEVASLSGSDIYVDIGGFIGLGETRALIKADQIQDVKDDRIVLNLSEAEAKKLPAADEQPAATPAQKQ